MVGEKFLGGIRQALERIREPSLTVLVALELFGLFIAAPLSVIGVSAPLSGSAWSMLIIATALVVVSGHRAAAMTVVATTAGTVIADLLLLKWPSTMIIFVDLAMKGILLAMLTWVIGSVVFGPGRVTSHRIFGAVAIYLQVALIFSCLFIIVAGAVPNAFSPAVALSSSGDEARFVYFSLATLTTTGYGDIVPIHPIARSLANLEAVIGQLFPATLLARLVTLELEHRRRS
jgi:hypothetical protein